MKKYRLYDYLEQILGASKNACDFVESMNEDIFLRDIRTQQAVNMSIIIIGEAVTKIIAGNKEFTLEHPEIAWRKIRGMRNRLTREYFETDFELV